MSEPKVVLQVELTADQLDLLADVLVERLQAETPPRRNQVDAATIARELGVSREYVYSHAVELGGVKTSNGPRARWRFDPDRAREAWQPPSEPARATPRRRRHSPDSDANLLPVRRTT